MTTPDDPVSPSSTGWPTDNSGATPPPPPPARPPAVSPPVEPVTPVDPVAPAAPVASAAPVEPVAAGAPEPGQPAAPEPASQPIDDASAGAGTAEVPPPRTARAPGPLRSAPVLALLLMTVLMAAATGVVWYQVHRDDQTEQARQQALETSRDAARVLFSYDYRTLDKDFAAGKAITTGKFRNDYANTTSKVVTPVATDKKAVVKADVVTAGVVRATPDTVVTIVFVNQVTTSSLQAGPKVDLSRVRMTVKHVGGRWLVSNVEAL